MQSDYCVRYRPYATTINTYQLAHSIPACVSICNNNTNGIDLHTGLPGITGELRFYRFCADLTVAKIGYPAFSTSRDITAIFGNPAKSQHQNKTREPKFAGFKISSTAFLGRTGYFT